MNQGIDLGVAAARRALAEFLIRRGRVEESIRELVVGVRSCDSSARHQLLKALQATGRIDQIETLIEDDRTSGDRR